MTSKPLEIQDPSTSAYVLPAAPRGVGEIVVVPAGPRLVSEMRRGGEVARVLGDRFLAHTECQQHFLAEVRSRLVALDGALVEDSRAQLRGALREVLSVLDWCDAVQSDMQQESSRAATGAEPIDVVDLCRAVAAAVGPADLVQVSGQLAKTWWGEARTLARVLELALALVEERTGGSGRRFLEVSSQGAHPVIRVASSGDPREGVDADVVRRFRQAVEQLGARVLPDAVGPGGSGLLLQLPACG
ncbi:MAG TPA: hypothetical protein VF384_15295 [Planctomycetota bacterium]